MGVINQLIARGHELVGAGMYLPCRPRKTPAVPASPPMPVRAPVLRGDIYHGNFKLPFGNLM